MLRTARVVGLTLAALAGVLLVAGPAGAGDLHVGIHFGIPYPATTVLAGPPVVVVPAPGYWPPAPVHVTPGAWYGVPHHRHRVIVHPGHGHGRQGHWHRGHGHHGHPGHGHWKGSVHRWHR
jgi:hypothetical protein